MTSTANANTAYDVEAYAKFRPDYDPRIIRSIAEKAGIKKGSIVVDIGSGPGNTAAPMLDAGAIVYGVDPDLAMIAKVKERFHANPAFSITNGTAQKTNLFLQNTADIVMAGNVAVLWEAKAANTQEKIKAQKDFLDEVDRVLKPDGVLCIAYNKYVENADVNVKLDALLVKLSQPGTYEKKISRLTNPKGFERQDVQEYFSGTIDTARVEYDHPIQTAQDLWDFLLAHTFFDQGKSLKNRDLAKAAVEAFFDANKNDQGRVMIPHYSVAYIGKPTRNYQPA